jgi:hypothetical protein
MIYSERNKKAEKNRVPTFNLSADNLMPLIIQIESRVARFSMVHDTQTGKNVPNEHKMYQMVITCPKCTYVKYSKLP